MFFKTCPCRSASLLRDGRPVCIECGEPWVPVEVA